MATSRFWTFSLMRYHEDFRRRFWGDLFATDFGDINVVQLHPGVIIAWHRHQRQDDHIFVVYGSVHIQAIDEQGQRHGWHLDAPRAFPVRIPAKWWHGYSSPMGATLVQFNGPGKWDGSDEERKSLEEVPWNPIP